ncbi:hypothetical protein KC19_2G170900 [Ceratodon purpureus]|uniref:Uncharacterized protein n=1 Tax=Ceratodon purpureus TaxID=3225 RepID=A0A8T0IYQ4_CERPU|nr:hypothetical protein KC19_2G170900 [Ceratodon purpureus]
MQDPEIQRILPDPIMRQVCHARVMFPSFFPMNTFGTLATTVVRFDLVTKLLSYGVSIVDAVSIFVGIFILDIVKGYSRLGGSPHVYFCQTTRHSFHVTLLYGNVDVSRYKFQIA